MLTTIQFSKAKKLKLVKKDLERADQNRPTRSRRGLFALPTFKKMMITIISDDFDSSDERLMEENDLKKAKLLSQRYSK